jgi:hypothetical protein
MIMHLVDKLERRRARAERKRARGQSYGKRSAHVRSNNKVRRREFVENVSRGEARAYKAGRPKA